MKPSEKLAQSLTLLKNLQERGTYAIQSKDLRRIDRERLVKNGFKPSYVNRLTVMWYEMRRSVMAYFPALKKQAVDIKKNLEQVEVAYTNDAYHSLSIEGYQ